MEIRIILNEDEKCIDLLYNNYNIIKTTIYNEELTQQILKMIEEELKSTEFDFTTLKEFLKMK